MLRHSHDAFSRGLTPLACWTYVHFYGIFLGASPLLPESLTVSPCRGALLGRCTDRNQMLLECGRGQQRSVEASLQLWLIGVRMKLGVTFLDCDPPLSHFPSSFTLSLSSIYPVCCQAASWCLAFYVPCWDGVEPGGEQTALRFMSGSLPHLSWAFNELFYNQRLNLNHIL